MFTVADEGECAAGQVIHDKQRQTANKGEMGTHKTDANAITETKAEAQHFQTRKANHKTAATAAP